MPRKSVHACELEKNVFAKRLTKVMKERRENQTTLAEKITEQYITIQRQTISLYMSGQSKPDTERLTAIAKVLDVSADWLLGLSEEPAINGDLAQAARYTGLPADSAKRLHELSTSTDAHPKSLLFVIERILNDRADDFITWAWRAAMSNCCTGKAELGRIRYATDAHLVEVANDVTEEIPKTVEVSIVDYEYISTSTAIGIIRDSADRALQDFKNMFSSAFQAEKYKK